MGFSNIFLFLVITGGIFTLLKISPIEFLREIVSIFERRQKSHSISDRVEILTGKKKEKGIKLLIKDTNNILERTQSKGKFSNICIISIVLMIIGIFLALSISNILLIPILAFGFGILPFLYIKVTANAYERQLNDELESSLSMITNSYLRNEDIILSIEENIDYFNPLLENIFRKCLYKIKLSPNITEALEELRDSIDNDIFVEWVNRVIQCQTNRTLKSPLRSTVSKFSNVKILNEKVNNKLMGPAKSFLMMTCILYGSIFMLKFLNIDWFKNLMYTLPGQISICITVSLTFFSIIQISKLIKPIDYKSINE
ncbi:TPA: hypothetical protein KON86_002779 [Clostridioides difficile]|uniref:hypothetical protein n=1 Tax=Clostridioides difficile TaxID=1496 RepID=UPI0007BB6F1F|nr:hypothetical protein [Clostridioides difficile]MBY2228992.1 hypothetical protein [Clostridioides difficile]MBY2832762.1 hypothetical protein [Clostridioides difficile]UUV16688.1 hypothetical protein NQ183_20395 [Clostridioides difficile]CZR99451.1 hypothetical protein CDFC105_64289 [Clostridioides difficile]CZS03565.1 hypothetical protein CDFC105_71230 [Clostridioides difficile]